MKRYFEAVLAFFIIMILSPVFVWLAIVVYWSLGRPIFYKQLRAGRYGAPFSIYKFRTMTNERNEAGELLADEVRLTQAGAFLRRHSLDELPQLFNVLKGDMSLVGPRPLFLHYVPLYNEEQARRLNVKPGLTGWSQVNGRNSISWEEKFKQDVWYVDNRTIWIDFHILLLTFLRVFRPKDIHQPERATVDPFQGNNEAK